MRSLFIVIGASALGLLAGCSDDLDRGKASELIAATPLPDEIHHAFGEKVLFCLIENGYVQANIFGASLTPEGQKYFRTIQFNSYRNQSGFTFVQPVTFASVDVTGLTDALPQGDDPPKRIEFTASYSFTGIPADSPAHKCLSLAPAPIKGSAVAQKYDDGWRITGWDIPAFTGMSM